MRPYALLLIALAASACDASNWDAWTGPCAVNADCVISYASCEREPSGQVAVLWSEAEAMRQVECPSCPSFVCAGDVAICRYDPHAVALCDRGRCARLVMARGGGGETFSRCEVDSECVAHDRCGRPGYGDCPSEVRWFAPIRRDHVAAYEELAGCTGVDETVTVGCVSGQCERVAPF